MLCPQCGSEVGDNVRLCDDCDALRKERLAVEDAVGADADGEFSVEEALPALDAPEGTSSTPAKSRSFRTIFICLTLFALLLGGKVVFREFSKPGRSPQSGEESGGEGTKPPIASTGSPFSPYLGEGKSGVRVGRNELQLKYSLALYHRQTQRLEIAFFREWNQTIDDGILRRQGTLQTVQSIRPDALLSLNFRPGQSACGLGSLDEYRLTLFKNADGLPLPGEQVSFPVKSVGGALGSGVTTAFESLRCVFEDAAKIGGTFRGSKQFTVLDETQSISWELTFDLPLIGPKTGAELVFDGRNAKAAMALWKAGRSELVIGFFGEELTGAEKERIRRSGSFDMNEEKKPDVVLSFTLAPGSVTLKPENVKTYGVLFFRDRTQGFDFPGIDPQVGAFYVGTAANGGTLDKLSGDISERANVSGRYTHSASKKIGATEVKMRWDLPFNVPIHDTSMQSESALEEAGRAEEIDATPEKAPYGVLDVDGAQVQVRAVLPLYYERSGDLSIGFYVDDLTADERAEVIKRRTLATYVNRKRPTLVLTLDFPEDARNFRRQDLKSYTLYFYREANGSFNFPGFHDVVSMKRSAEQIPEEELLSISGGPGEGGKAKLRHKGEGQASGNPALFRWDLSYELEPIVLR